MLRDLAWKTGENTATSADQIKASGTTKQWSQAPDDRATPPTGAWLSLLQMLGHIATVDPLEDRPGACGGDCQGLIVRPAAAQGAGVSKKFCFPLD